MAVIGPVFKRTMSASVLLLLAACGGGGGGAAGNPPGNPTGDTMTVTVWSKTTASVTTTYIADGGATTSYGSVYSSPSLTTTSVLINSPTVQVVVSADGDTAGTYPITSNLAKLSVRYTVYGTPTTSTIIYGTDASGTIILSSVGAVGQPITGSFAAVVFEGSPVSDPSNTLGVSGTFSMKRWF